MLINNLLLLCGFKTIKVVTGYKIGSKEAGYVSGDASYLAKCQPVYQTLPGWQQDISSVRNFKDLPKNAQNYIKTVENFVSTKVDFIGVGPARGEEIYV